MGNETEKPIETSLLDRAQKVVSGSLPPGAMFAWTALKNGEIWGEDNEFVGDFSNPPCFGGVFGGEGDYVSAARAYEALPTRLEMSAWVALNNAPDDESLATEVAELVSAGREPELGQLAADLAEHEDALFYYTEISPYDFNVEELDELRESRPDLFDAEGEPIYSWPDKPEEEPTEGDGDQVIENTR